MLDLINKSRISAQRVVASARDIQSDNGTNRADHLPDPRLQPRELERFDSVCGGQRASALNWIEGKAPKEVKGLFKYLRNELAEAQNEFGIDFPLLENPRGGVFNLLLGQDVAFVRFFANLRVPAYTTQLFPLYGGNAIQARLNGAIDLEIHVNLGYDTYGLRKFVQTGDPLRLASGFYFDTSRGDLVKLSGQIAAGDAVAPFIPPYLVPTPIGLPVPITPIFSINGQLSVEDLRVWIPSATPKMRFFENIPRPLFRTSGLFTAEFNFVVEVGIPKVVTVELFRETIARTVLLDLDNGPLSNPTNPVDLVPPPPEQPREWFIDLERLRAQWQQANWWRRKTGQNIDHAHER